MPVTFNRTFALAVEVKEITNDEVPAATVAVASPPTIVPAATAVAGVLTDNAVKTVVTTVPATV